MASVKTVNPDAEVVAKSQALLVNVGAAKGLQGVLKTNLGPRGTLKMLVGGAGQIKLTKDGNTLLHEMQIQHPTAALIARTATAQDDITGDGTTSTVLFCGELLKQAERYLAEGLHPRVISDGFDLAKAHVLNFLDEFKVKKPEAGTDRDLLVSVARTSLCTKLQEELALQMVEIVADCILCIKIPDEPIDLHMVEIMHMVHQSASDTRFVPGIVCDHGARHPDMPSSLKNCHIMILNVSLEYEQTTVQSGFFYGSAEEREKMVSAERNFTEERVKQIIDLKNEMCPEGSGKNFVIINQKGIDPPSLDLLAKAGILALRRAKRRNMERLTLACGGTPLNHLDSITPDMLGFADSVSEQTLGEDKFTFVEGCKNPQSCTILVKGPNDHTIAQIKEAVRDGLRAVKNVIEDESVVPGAGAFEIAAAASLREYKQTITGRSKLGIEAYADALEIIPKTLAVNSGFDVQDCLLALQEEHMSSKAAVGLDCTTGEPMMPETNGIWDNFRVKRQSLHLATVLSTQLLLVDEVMRAGRKMGGGPAPQE